MKKDLFNKYLEVAKSTGIKEVVDMIETFSPFEDCVNIFGENPKKADLINFWLETTDEDTIFTSRHYAERAKKASPYLNSDYRIIKICAGGDSVGYKVISPSDYIVFRLQR